MNKFPAEYCKGLQTFFSENDSSSKVLAELIQDNARVLQTSNKRLVKKGNETIFILKNLNVPAVLVECGFLSNKKEAELLQIEAYKLSLSFSISCGIAEFLES
jgi:N-acetylmuramoyl-L-alanine amidase